MDSWEGPAHRTYRIREQEQEQAAGQVSEGVREVGLWLSEVGVANVEFVAKLVEQGGQVIDKIVEVSGDGSVVATTGDPASGQEAINDLAAALGRFAANLLNYLAGLGARLAQVVGMVTKVAATHSDYRTFPGGHWPPAVQSGSTGEVLR